MNIKWTSTNRSMSKLEAWICAWARLFSGLIAVVTFTKIDPGFDIDITTYYVIKNSAKRKS